MSVKRKYRRILIIIFLVGLVCSGWFINYTLDHYVPDHMSVFEGKELGLSDEFLIQYVKKNESGVETAQAGRSEDGVNTDYQVQARLFGWIPCKTIQVSVLSDEMLIPCGRQIGIYLQTKGVLVIGTSEIRGMDGMTYSPTIHIIKADDYIISLNGIKVSTKSQLSFLINKYGSQDIVLGIERNGAYIEVSVKPVRIKEGEYQLGLWVRDDMQGIGTMTYIKSDGSFGALGHGISDIDTGKLLSTENGILYAAHIWGIHKGKSGEPGGLLGTIAYEKENVIGEIEENSNDGIFGTLNKSQVQDLEQDALPVGLKQEIHKGKASILCTLKDETVPREYQIEIEEVDMRSKNKNKGMIIRIVDPELLAQTNGIVQGMSGSPILQDGKLIGAVTHVFVNEPARGYGIFIENMLEH